MKHREVLDILMKYGRTYIVGSHAIYEALCIKDIASKDIDIVIKTDTEVEEIRRALLEIGGTFVSTNNFGGIKINFRGQIFDIWRVKDTRIFEPEFERKYRNITDVISNFGFNIYQVAICVDDDMILSTKAFQEYSRTQALQLVHQNIRNLEFMTQKALAVNKYALGQIR